MQAASTQSDSGELLTPLIVGVTGHRDLVPQETDVLEKLVIEFINELRGRFPHTPIRVMSALAEGADRLAAHAAIKCGADLHVVLPMPADEYMNDFETAESKAEFETLCERAEVFTLPVTGKTDQDAELSGDERTHCYANVGMFISAHCHVLLALWDGVYSDKLGGTSQIIYFHHYDRLPGLSESVPRSSLFLTDVESDLVYHISCSRQHPRVDADPPLQCHWFTTNAEPTGPEKMPERYVRVFQRGDAFNDDIQRHLDAKEAPSSTEADPPETNIRKAAERIRQAFDVADALANHFQNRVSMTMTGIYSLAALTGLAFVLFSEIDGLEFLIYAFLAFLMLGMILSIIAKKREWHRKYLDYRVLAEGLRVQFYRAIAGIQAGGHTKFAYDNFLRQRDTELGWIRNVMRVAGVAADAQPAETNDTGLQFAIDHWIGSKQQPGQLQYYRRKAVQRARTNRVMDTIALACLWGGILAASYLAFFVPDDSLAIRDPLIVLMGVLPLVAGIAETYTQRKADRELTKQYQFMRNVFGNARKQLEIVTSDAERREVLEGLGDAALSEHAEWILVHRERQPEPASV